MIISCPLHPSWHTSTLQAWLTLLTVSAVSYFLSWTCVQYSTSSNTHSNKLRLCVTPVCCTVLKPWGHMCAEQTKLYQIITCGGETNEIKIQTALGLKAMRLQLFAVFSKCCVSRVHLKTLKITQIIACSLSPQPFLSIMLSRSKLSLSTQPNQRD